LYEPYLSDARAYVELAEKCQWSNSSTGRLRLYLGEALLKLRRAEVDLSIINLETVITTAETAWLGKEIHYRMHPRNIDCLSVAESTDASWRNNHVLDWGYEGLSKRSELWMRWA